MQIRVIRGGCGIRYTDAYGTQRHALKTRESGAFECEDDQAKRLISMGVAQLAGKNGIPEEEEAMEESKAHLSKKDLSSMSIEQLRLLAADMGVDGSGRRKKAELVSAITAQAVQTENVEDNGGRPDFMDASEMIV